MSPLIHPDGNLELTEGQTLFDYADALRVRVPTSCGRTGECHECIVEVKQGWDALTSPTEPESFLRGNFRLACQAAVADPGANIEFAVLRRQPKILTKGAERDFEPDPLVVRHGDGVYSLHEAWRRGAWPPSQSPPASQGEKDGPHPDLPPQGEGNPALPPEGGAYEGGYTSEKHGSRPGTSSPHPDLPPQGEGNPALPREGPAQGEGNSSSLPPKAEYDGGSLPPDAAYLDRYRGGMYGLAVDVGTTTVVMNLVDLEAGKTIHTASFENPQRFGGSDTMHRISYDGGEFHGELTAVIHSSINFEIGDMCRRLKVRRRAIYEMVVVGNSTMRDLFFGLPVQSIGEKPYRSVTEFEFREGGRETTALMTTAKELGIRIHPQAVVYGGPLVGSHVGADVAADLLAVSMDEEEEPVILVDVGTNSEIVAGNKDRLMAASCPAGPAFEGGGVKYAMPGYDGAVESISLNDGAIEYSTIGGAAAEGICGSGLIDLLAELRRTDRMNELGAFPGGTTEFVFEPERALTLSRADISALAQAKSANYCGQMIVLDRYGIPVERYKALYLAGGFANYVDVKNALDIGFMANIPADRIVKVGNASLQGATIMLMSGRLRRRMEEMTRDIEHVELETEPEFFEFFVEGCQFKPMVAG